MNCDEVKELLLKYILNDVSSEERKSIQEHIAMCPDCKEEQEAFANTYADIRQAYEETVAEASPSPHAWASIKEQIAKKDRRWLPNITSIKSTLVDWGKRFRVRPLWQRTVTSIIIVGAIVGLLITALYNGSSPTATGYWDPSYGKIAFMSNRDHVDAIYVMTGYDIDSIRISDEDADLLRVSDEDTGRIPYYGTVWSPDASKIAFNVDVPRFDLPDPRGFAMYNTFVANADGSGETNLNNWIPEYTISFPEWSPDGNKIAYDSYHEGRFEIWVMNTDGTGKTRLIDPASSNYEGGPSWSPDGSKIAFRSDRDGDWAIYMVNSDGTNIVRLTDFSNTRDRLLWSPDGNKIAFTSDHEVDDQPQLYTINSDGTDLTKLTDLSHYLYPPTMIFPSWSPDGSKIAFHFIQDGEEDNYSFDIYTVNADGTNLTRLTNSVGFDIYPSWSRNSLLIAFESRRDGNAEIYIMNADGTDQTNITNNPARDMLPIWSP